MSRLCVLELGIPSISTIVVYIIISQKNEYSESKMTTFSSFVRSSAVSSFVSSKEEILICHRRRMRGSPVQFRFSENTALPTMKFELLCLQNRIAERS